ncbi:MAG: radical SAM protein, partial [Deltaproteobacteria bacterium]|nr:radical SAM protein [Deltaproteobacteria bacterium]
MSVIFPKLKTPSNLDVEITTACNLKCRHCYNFWQHNEGEDPGKSVKMMSIEQADNLIEQIIENKIFHVVLTGGECMTNYKVLTHFMRELSAVNVSFSMNSNLMLATPEKMSELAELGLPHTLTSLNSYVPEINDKMVSQEGAFEKIVAGIKCAVDAGIRVSVNMIITQLNKTHVYKTGLLLAELGVTNMFTTRMVPSTSAGPELSKELQVSPDEEKKLILDEAIRVRDETGINIGSLIQYPVCFLKDVAKYRDYVGRGCPAGKKMLCINADGVTEACSHDHKDYGNVFTDGVKKCWENMMEWRDDSLIPPICLKCSWLKYCEGACRLYTKTPNGMDLLAEDPRSLPDTSMLESDYTEMVTEKEFIAPERLRWRKEDDFTLVNIRGARVFELDDKIADFLIKCQETSKIFTSDDFPGSKNELGRLLELWIVETTD